MNVPCKDCALNAPEQVSSMLQPKSKLFAMGWHVHKYKQGYVTFMDNKLFDKYMKTLYAEAI